MFKAAHDSLVSLVWPQACQVCSGIVDSLEDGLSCSTCWNNTQIFDGTEMFCGRCSAVLGPLAAPKPVFCRKCDDYNFERATAVGVYEKALASEIIGLKNNPTLCPRIRALIRNCVHSRLTTGEIDLIVPVPLSKPRMIERGFNQADVIADTVSDITSIPSDKLSLLRRRHTPIHRSGMDQKAREATVAKTFEVVRPNLIRGKNILIVDDVLTSGATTSACAHVLKRVGAGRVTVFTLARAVLG